MVRLGSGRLRASEGALSAAKLQTPNVERQTPKDTRGAKPLHLAFEVWRLAFSRRQAHHARTGPPSSAPPLSLPAQRVGKLADLPGVRRLNGRENVRRLLRAHPRLFALAELGEFFG